MDSMKQKRITAVLMGAGSRGREAYGAWGLKNPTKIKFVAVAGPDDGRGLCFQKNILFLRKINSRIGKTL